MSNIEILQNLEQHIRAIEPIKAYGCISGIKGIIAECKGIGEFTKLGSKCAIKLQSGKDIISEVVGFDGDKTLIMPFSSLEGAGVYDKVEVIQGDNLIRPDRSWLGRVINGFGEPIDEKGLLPQGKIPYPLRNSPPNPQKRNQLKTKIDLGIRALDAFVSCCYGQRLGIFAGSGVGKSVLVSMITKYAKTDVKIIGLIGERGREVNEFLNEYLGEEGLKDAIIVVATGDEPPLLRKQAAYLTMTIAEYFRDQGLEVMCIMDSVTRFAMAQREIGLATGEPPSSKGYTPTVFSELPKLLERAGPGVGKGNITGLFTVLVEGDDHNEPISDAVRGILDGHVILDRAIAERGRFPAINVLKSVSRTLPKCNTEVENRLMIYARKLLATYNDMEEMIRIGAYRKGSNPEVDMAIQYYPQLESFLSQKPDDHTAMETSFRLLSQILNLQNYYEGTANSNKTSQN
ncbi:MAG: fliI [Rickettsiaceae bacterium]|jgi:flagellum-specific ATP synthase|nr:fliI [Rickettsiaceae bacterium]